MQIRSTGLPWPWPVAKKPAPPRIVQYPPRSPSPCEPKGVGQAGSLLLLCHLHARRSDDLARREAVPLVAKPLSRVRDAAQHWPFVGERDATIGAARMGRGTSGGVGETGASISTTPPAIRRQRAQRRGERRNVVTVSTKRSSAMMGWRAPPPSPLTHRSSMACRRMESR